MTPRSRQRGFIINPYRFSSAPATDPHFANVTLLAHFDGTNGSTTFTDNGPLAQTLTANGNAQISTAQSKFGGASLGLDGTGDFVTSSYASSPIGTGDFTVEFWVRPNVMFGVDYNVLSIMNATTSTNAFIGNDSAFGDGTNMRFAIRNDAQTTNLDIRSAVNRIGDETTFYHVACVADGSTGRLYINGVQEASGSITGTRTATFTNLNLGRLHASATRYLNGHLDDVRITKGVCRYPSGTTFSPPSAAFPNS